jgi:glucokinase
LERRNDMVGAIDVGGTKIAVGIVDPNGNVLSRFEAATQGDGPYDNALDRTVTMLRAALAATGAKIKGIGIGSTGPVDPFTGEIGDVNFFPGWRGRNPVPDLKKIFGVSVAMENDADAAALGEAGWGVGKNKSSLIYVTVGTGIGAGIILNGQVYRGVDRAHPEIGHHVIDPSGPLCSCGFRGCWESLAAGPGMVTWMESNAPPDYPHRSGLTAKKICELALAGDDWARRAVNHEARYLGLGLANLVTMFVPEIIILGGSVMKSAALFMDEIRKVIAASCRFVPFHRTDLALASLGDDTNLIGAARVWYHRFASDGGSGAA